MIVIRKDPQGLTGQERHPWDHSKTIHENITLHLASGNGCMFILNGQIIDPLQCAALDRKPTRFDFLTVINRPAGIETMIYIAIATAVVSYALMPKMPGIQQVGKDSPNNSLTAQTNRARAYQGLPDVYGYKRCWPDLIQPSVIEYIDHSKYVTETLCVTLGDCDVAAIQYADTPIDDVEGASYEVFGPAPGAGYPESRTTTITNVVEPFAAPDVDGQEIENLFDPKTANGIYSQSGPFDGRYPWYFQFADGAFGGFKPKLGEEIRIDLTLADSPFEVVSFVGEVVAFPATPAGEWGMSIKTGPDFGGRIGTAPITIRKTTVGPFTLPLASNKLRFNTVFLRGLEGSIEINAEWWAVNTSGAEISLSRQTQTFTFSANTKDQRFFTTDITPSYGNGQYRIQFTRLTADNDNVAKLEGLFALRAYATKQLPGVTVIRVTTKATQEATGFRDRKFNCRVARHVRTLTSDTLSASRNFARIMAHIWTIAGNNIAELDTAAMQAINTAMGVDSPLLRFDGSLDDADMSLGDRLQTVANHARCLFWRDGTKYTVTRDQARPYAEVQLDYRNLAGGGDSVISVSAHLPASFDGVEIEYTNEATQATKAYVRLNITTGAPVVGTANNYSKTKLPGCATVSQATNRAYLEANKLLYQRASVTDEVLSDGGIIGPGTLVRWVDPNDFFGDDGLQAGEVLAIEGSVITTSEPLQWIGETTGRIILTRADGSSLAPVVVTPGAAPNKAVLASIPSGVYTAGSGAQLGSRYAFGPGLSAAEIEAAGLFTVTGIKPAGGGKSYTLELAQYDARIYSND